MAIKYQDGIILGAVAGLALTTPQFVTWIWDFLNGIIPSSWYILGSWSLSVFGAVIGAVVGYLVDKTN